MQPPKTICMKYKVVVMQMEGRLIIIVTHTSSLLTKKQKKLGNFEIKLSLSAKHTHLQIANHKQPGLHALPTRSAQSGYV